MGLHLQVITYSFFRESVVENLAGAVNDPVFYPWEVRMVIDFILLCTMS